MATKSSSHIPKSISITKNFTGVFPKETKEYSFEVIPLTDLGVFVVHILGVPPLLVFDFSLTCWHYLAWYIGPRTPKALEQRLVAEWDSIPDLAKAASLVAGNLFEASVIPVENHSLKLEVTPSNVHSAMILSAAMKMRELREESKL